MHKIAPKGLFIPVEIMLGFIMQVWRSYLYWSGHGMLPISSWKWLTLVVILHKLFKKTILKIFLHSESCARHSLMADRYELQIKHQLILIILHAVQLSTEILAVHLKCLEGMIYIISISQQYRRAWIGKWFTPEYPYHITHCW